jgi:hypothetical protein
MLPKTEKNCALETKFPDCYGWAESSDGGELPVKPAIAMLLSILPNPELP